MSHFFGLFLLCLAVTLAVLGNGHKPWILRRFTNPLPLRLHGPRLWPPQRLPEGVAARSRGRRYPRPPLPRSPPLRRPERDPLGCPGAGRDGPGRLAHAVRPRALQRDVGAGPRRRARPRHALRRRALRW